MQINMYHIKEIVRILQLSVRRHLCFHPRVQCPDYDTMAAQKLMLELNESDVLQVANFS
jgi:hypothetical protein